MRLVWLAAMGGLALFLLCSGAFACQNVKIGPTPAAVALLPTAAGDFRETDAPEGFSTDLCTAALYGIAAGAVKHYASTRGDRLTVSLVQMRSPSSAYSYLTTLAILTDRPSIVRLNDVGTASNANSKGVSFVRGSYFVTVEIDRRKVRGSTRAREFGRKLAETLGNDSDEIPVLIKLLPEWEKTYPRALFLLDIVSLYNYFDWKVAPIPHVLKFDAGEEAGIARYGRSQLLIVDNRTPQLASEADTRIQKTLNELRAAGRLGNTFYRRRGNSSAFVFNAREVATADWLFNQITHEKP